MNDQWPLKSLELKFTVCYINLPLYMNFWARSLGHSGEFSHFLISPSLIDRIPRNTTCAIAVFARITRLTVIAPRVPKGVSVGSIGAGGWGTRPHRAEVTHRADDILGAFRSKLTVKPEKNSLSIFFWAHQFIYFFSKFFQKNVSN